MHPIRLAAFVLAACVASASHAALPPDQQAKLDAKIADIRLWAADPVVTQAVVAQNTATPPAFAEMTQEKWKTLTVLAPFVRAFSKNAAAVALKARKTDWVSEAFVSDAAGLKVAFLAKTSGWSHAGKPKHDRPMAGETWQGEVELDESTGLQQVQVAVPIIAEGKPVGSLVVGVSLSKLD